MSAPATTPPCTAHAIPVLPSVGASDESATRWACDRGSVAVELGVAAVIWVVVMLVLGAVYQLSTSSDDVADAAGQAARAASLTSAPGDAIDVATTLARQRLSVGACNPASVGVDVDVSDFHAAGSVRVTVTCRTRPRIGPARTLSSSADEVIDTYRGGA